MTLAYINNHAINSYMDATCSVGLAHPYLVIMTIWLSKVGYALLIYSLARLTKQGLTPIVMFFPVLHTSLYPMWLHHGYHWLSNTIMPFVVTAFPALWTALTNQATTSQNVRFKLSIHEITACVLYLLRWLCHISEFACICIFCLLIIFIYVLN